MVAQLLRRRRTSLFLLFFALAAFAKDPDVLYLTWRDDPSTTITVMWHDSDATDSTLYYKPEGAGRWLRTRGRAESLVKTNVMIHTVDILELQPNTNYIFKLEGGEEKRFRTLPNNLDEPLTVAIGGDAYYTTDLYVQMNELVAKEDPAFVIMAGDIAYSEGLRRMFKTKKWKVNRWEEFFRIWTRTMVTSDGRMIPIMPVIGNHDLLEGFDNPMKKDVIFYQVFAFPTKGHPYQTIRVGDDAAFFLLDSGHSYPIGGAQTEWLEKELQKPARHKIPAYHIAGYPTETSFSHRGALDVRKFWCPLFEKYGVKVSMEHDNHTFKRTFPLKAGGIADDGVIYLGDGSWGTPPLKPQVHWYLAKALQSTCYWKVTLTRDEGDFKAYDASGQLLDEVKILSSTS